MNDTVTVVAGLLGVVGGFAMLLASPWQQRQRRNFLQPIGVVLCAAGTGVLAWTLVGALLKGCVAP